MIKSLSNIRVLDRLRNLLNVQTPGGGVDDILVDAALLVDFVGVAALLHASVFERVDVVSVDNLGDAVRDDDDGAVFLDGIEAVLDLLGTFVGKLVNADKGYAKFFEKIYKLSSDKIYDMEVYMPYSKVDK